MTFASVSPSNAVHVPQDLSVWLSHYALSLDQHEDQAEQVLSKLAQADLFSLGIDNTLHPAGRGTMADAIHAVIQVASYSFTAAFVFWAQRAFIECLLGAEQAVQQQARLSALLRGERAGAVGLSNAIKFLGGVESLQIQAEQAGAGYVLTGQLPWVSNVPLSGYFIAAAVQMPDASQAVWLLEQGDKGLKRSENLDLIALRGSNTAAFMLEQSSVGTDRLLHSNLSQFIQQVRPRFLALQCSMAVGLALRCVQQIKQSKRASTLQQEEAEQLQQRLQHITHSLIGFAMQTGSEAPPAELFRLRIELSQVVDQASTLEQAAVGGEVYLLDRHPETLRRMREALFVPLITPSVAQLAMQLSKADRKP